MQRSQLSVKEVIESYLQLEKKGKDYRAICPFHEDTNPSLFISLEKNIFKCFSCGVGGDAVSFIMRKEKASYQQALIKAHKILKLPFENLLDPVTYKDICFKQQLIKFNEFVSEFFEKHLFYPSGKKALDYLIEERKLSVELIKKMRIGYAPSGLILLHTIERIKKSSEEYKFIDAEFLSKVGIFSKEKDKDKEEGGTLIPVFQNRITFPVFSTSNELIGFSARAMPDSRSEIRYLHSKETLLFKKAQLLYNLPALSELKNGEEVYLFEGCFDLFSLLVLKPNAKGLALMGRELSGDCLEILQKKEVKKIVLMLDSDRAGITASLKIIQQLLKVGIQPYSLEINLQACKDFSEFYCANPNLKLPEPTIFVDWIKSNWKKSIHKTSPETELLSLNQVVNALLSAIFKGESSRFFYLNPALEIQFAIDSLNKIFSLYELADLSEKEKEVILSKRQSYLEAVNLHCLSQNGTSRRIPPVEREQEKPKTIISNFSNILVLWTSLIKSKQSQEIIKKELQDWQSKSLEDYSELFQWILLPEERLFLSQLMDNLTTAETDLTFSNSKIKNVSFDNLWDFFEMYYSLIYLLLDKSETYLKSDHLTDLPMKLDWLKKIEIDRELLRSKSSNTFNRLLELEKI